jgi:hypothetical protein
MVLRLILVSIVAGLGVTPPAEGDLAGWSCTVQTWLDARLAEWNATQPLDRSESVSSPVLAEDFDITALESALMAAFGELPTTAAVPGRAPAAVDRAGADVDFEAVVEEIVADFGQEATETEPAASEIESPVWSEAEDLEAAITEAELDAGETSYSVAAPAMATLPAGEDVPFDSVDDCELPVPQGAAWARQAAGLTDPAWLDEDAPASGDTAAPTADNSLRDAVRLTREAVYAWWNLLQSPALVTVPE